MPLLQPQPRSLLAVVPVTNSTALAVVEILLLVTLFFVLAGEAPPSVNEAHYLAKAKHYWNPDWCRGDIFLESADAHLMFYWSFGWLTRFLSLETVAWIGRGVTWGLLAWSWRRLSVALLPGPLCSLLTAALFATLLRLGHMAGEWVIGGVEAKGFAYVFVLLGLEALVRDRWQRMWILFGVAAAFHVLVGGWSVVAAMIAWCCYGRERPAWISMLPSLVVGGLLALLGLVPTLALSMGVTPDVVSTANAIYVHQRLAHHLLFHQILSQRLTFDLAYLGIQPIVVPVSHLYFLRHAALVLIGVGLCRYVQPTKPVASQPEKANLQAMMAWRYVQPTTPVARLCWFVVGSVVIASIGIAIDQATMYREALAAQLLRYYWFRLSDVMVPMGVALLGALAIIQLRLTSRRSAEWALAAVILLVTLNTADVFARRWFDPRPSAVVQSQSHGDSSDERRGQYHDWLAVCDWIARTTPTDEVFLTPRHQQTFKWYAQRGEVVAWKDVPQDAAGVLEWRRRMDDIFPRQVRGYDLSAHSDVELLKLARKYHFRYIVVDRSRGGRTLGFARVYPTPQTTVESDRRSIYEVYRLPVELVGAVIEQEN